MSDIYEIINSLPEKEETKKLQIHLINHLEKEEMLLLALRSHKNSKDKQSLLKYFLETMSNEYKDEHPGNLCVVMIGQLE
ncbi:724_t:CDS:2, partial [Rhizophagus irregularis]